MFASAEATDAEAMLGAQNWALWLLTAAMLHPASEELWKYSELLPHHIPTEAPLNIRLLDPPPAVQAAEPEAPALPDDALTERLLEAFTWQSPNKALETIPVKVSVSAVTHAKQELTLRRPAFLQKSGMTGAERGTAIHAFLQSVPFGPQPPALEAEVQRQLDLHLLDPELAKVLDLEQVRPFFASGVWQRIAAARQVLREEPFITALPAGEVVPEAAGQGRAAKPRCWCRALPMWCWCLTTTPKFWTIKPIKAAMPPIILRAMLRSCGCTAVRLPCVCRCR